MPTQLIPNTDVKYSLISFDKDSKERTDDPEAANGLFSNKVLAEAAANPPSHVFLFSHGWKGDMPSAIDQYNRWIQAMVKLEADKQQMGPAFRPLWIGLHWPSKPLGDESFGGGGDFDTVGMDLAAIKAEAIEQMGDTPEIRASLDVIFKEQEENAAALSMPAPVADAYKKLANAIGYKSEGEGAAGPPDAEGKSFDPEATFEAAGDSDFSIGSFFGKLLSPLSQLSYWTMKYRGRSIGEGGMHNFVAALQNLLPNAKFHVMGHSFGCIVVSSILGGPNGNTPLPRPVDSLLLAQGALSLWAYSNKVKDVGKPGYFNQAFLKPAVKGPIVVTRSKNDKAVGLAYKLATAVVPVNIDGSFDSELTPTFLPLLGGIGTYGIRGLDSVVDLKMQPATGTYVFTPGKIYNLMSDEFVPSHNGIDGPEVAHAAWQAAIQS